MEGARLTIFPKRCLCGVRKTGRRGGEVDLKFAVCLGLLKPSTHCAKGTLAWISLKPRCGAPGNQSLTALHWPVLHPVWTQAYLSTHLSLHFTHLVNRFLKTNKIKFPIKDQKKKSSGAQESVPSWGDSSEQQDPGNQTSGDGGGSCSVHYLFPPPLPRFLGTHFPVSFPVAVESGWPVWCSVIGGHLVATKTSWLDYWM